MRWLPVTPSPPVANDPAAGVTSFGTRSCADAHLCAKRRRLRHRKGSAGKISPHTLRHTAATWLMQIGVSTWEAAGFLGMSEKTLRDVYGHHHPDYLHRAANAIGTKKPISLSNSLVRPTRRRLQPLQPVENVGGPGSTHIQPINASSSMRWVGMNNQDTDKYTVILRHSWKCEAGRSGDQGNRRYHQCRKAP